MASRSHSRSRAGSSRSRGSTVGSRNTRDSRTRRGSRTRGSWTRDSRHGRQRHDSTGSDSMRSCLARGRLRRGRRRRRMGALEHNALPPRHGRRLRLLLPDRLGPRRRRQPGEGPPRRRGQRSARRIELANAQSYPPQAGWLGLCNESTTKMVVGTASRWLSPAHSCPPARTIEAVARYPLGTFSDEREEILRRDVGGRRPGVVLERVLQLSRLDRLRQVGIHADQQALLAIALIALAVSAIDGVEARRLEPSTASRPVPCSIGSGRTTAISGCLTTSRKPLRAAACRHG